MNIDELRAFDTVGHVTPDADGNVWLPVRNVELLEMLTESSNEKP